RTMGPALALQRACLEDLSKGEQSFCFDFPSLSMLAVYKRLRIEATEKMIRFAKPLRVDRKVAEKIPIRRIARGVSALANAGLKLGDRFLSKTRDLIIATEPGPWGEEFTQTTSEWARTEDIRVARTGPYLNWRFGQHPVRPHRMLTARERGTLCGFLVYECAGQDGYIVELHARNDVARKALLGSAIEIAREEGVHTFNAPWLSAHRGRELLENYGLRPRERTPVVVLELRQNGKRRSNCKASEWFLTAVDRES